MTKPLSKAAQKMLTRLRQGAWYPWEPNKIPKAMQELIDAGLVGSCGRVKSIIRCWVPIGFQPAKQEVYPKEWPE